MYQHPLQAFDVIAVDAVEEIHPALLLFGLEHPRTHHRRQGQGNQRRNDNGHGHGHGKFAKQPAHHIAHKQQRDHHRDQRDGQRNDGEANLLRPLERGLHRRVAGFYIAGDVLDHDDRVIHHKTNGDGQRHQRQVIQRETQSVSHRQGADQRQRHGYRRNQGGRQVA